MNTEQVGSLVRQLLFTLSGAFGGVSLIGEDWVNLIISACVTLATGVWAIWTRSDKQIVVSAASKVDVPASAQREAGIEQPLKPTK